MNHKLNVGFIQLNSSFAQQYYLPLSAGMIISYCKQHCANANLINFKLPHCDYGSPAQIAKRFADCDLLAASLYVWNEQNTLTICEHYKKYNPNGIVVLGGPSVPNGRKQFRRRRTRELTDQERNSLRLRFTEDYHSKYPFIDYMVHGEGERVFSKLLDSIYENSKELHFLESVSCIKNGEFFFNPLMPRMTDSELEICPSPFLNGLFDEMVHTNPGKQWIVMYESDRGCPYQCTYCDWGGATEDKVSKFPMERIYQEIMWMGENKIPYVFLCNANFGILQRDVQIAKYFALCKSKFGHLEGVSTQNAKNPKPHTLEALRVLDAAGLNKATVMSQQSLNTDTLKAVRRDNMQLDEYDDIQRKLRRQGISTMTDLIFPMPHETYDSLRDSISTLIARGQYNRIQFNNLSILVNTEMGNPEYQQAFGMTLVRSKMINVHGSIQNEVGRLPEFQTLVVGTSSMPPKDWRRARVLCWTANLLFFNKIFQVPMILLREAFGIEYGMLVEGIVAADRSRFPCLSEILNMFEAHAAAIQYGRGEEYIFSSEYLKIYWPPEELAHIELCVNNKVSMLIDELDDLIRSNFLHVSSDLFSDSLKITKSLVRVPFFDEDVELFIRYNIPDFVKGVMLGEPVELRSGLYKVRVIREGTRLSSWDEWCRKVVWYGNRRGAYIYDYECFEEAGEGVMHERPEIINL